MKPMAYIETSVISYLAAWPSRDLVTAAHQQITHEWWRTRARDYSLFVSRAVVTEAASGDPDAAARRAVYLTGIEVLQQAEDAAVLAEMLTRRVPLPPRAAVDALHIAVSVTSGMDYQVTWNCTHIANAALRRKLEVLCRAMGYEPPAICTPEELMGDRHVERPDR